MIYAMIDHEFEYDVIIKQENNVIIDHEYRICRDSNN